MNHPRPCLPPTIIIWAIIAAATIPGATSLLLLSDLPTPSFIIDTQALRRHVRPPTSEDGPDASTLPFVPSIRCTDNDLLLRPSMTTRRSNSDEKDVIVDCVFEVVEGQPAIGYVHSAVVRAREEAVPGEDDPLSTFLAEIDADPALCCGRAKLVLGLNNHHVGGYYWARSAGAGASMEAPGVSFSSGSSSIASIKSERGFLRWINDEGPEACNSNDGKRSEWVNFLRRGDTVQLVPENPYHTLLQFRERFGKRLTGETFVVESSIRVFGISSKGRPMGSEPEVVCEWRSA